MLEAEAAMELPQGPQACWSLGTDHIPIDTKVTICQFYRPFITKTYAFLTYNILLDQFRIYTSQGLMYSIAISFLVLRVHIFFVRMLLTVGSSLKFHLISLNVWIGQRMDLNASLFSIKALIPVLIQS